MWRGRKYTGVLKSRLGESMWSRLRQEKIRIRMDKVSSTDALYGRRSFLLICNRVHLLFKDASPYLAKILRWS